MKTMVTLILSLAVISLTNGCTKEELKPKIYIPSYEKKTFKRKHIKKRMATIKNTRYLLLTRKEVKEIFTEARERLRYINVLEEVVESVDTQLKIGEHNETQKV